MLFVVFLVLGSRFASLIPLGVLSLEHNLRKKRIVQISHRASRVQMKEPNSML